MFNRVRFVSPTKDNKLIVEFASGVTKEYDMKHILNKFPIFKDLLNDKEKFMSVKVDVGGYGIIWDDYFDLSCNELWDKGTILKTEFDGLLSFSDASKIWKLNESTLRKAISYGKLKSGIDASKFGHQWIVTYNAMIREYGKPKIN